MTKKEIEQIASGINEVAKELLVELESRLRSPLISRLDKIEEKLGGVDSRIVNIADAFKGKESRLGGFPGYNRGRIGFAAGRIENIENYLELLSDWLREHPHCVCKDMDGIPTSSWHCPVHGQVEVK